MISDNWIKKMFQVTDLLKTWSKDRSTGVGAVVMGPHHEIRATGYNGFARGVEDDLEIRHLRPEKYLWTVHAEANAIFAAARTGVPLVGCTIFCSLYPCARCADAIIQAGITTVFVDERNGQDVMTRWEAEHTIAELKFQEAGIPVYFYNGE